MSNQLEVILSALAGSAVSGSVCGYLAKAYIQKCLKDLETVLNKLAELTISQAVANVRLDRLEKLIPKIEEHGLAIAALTRRYQNGKDRGLHNTDS